MKTGGWMVVEDFAEFGLDHTNQRGSGFSLV